MTANFQQELDRIVERRSQATQLDTFLHVVQYGYLIRSDGILGHW